MKVIERYQKGKKIKERLAKTVDPSKDINWKQNLAQAGNFVFNKENKSSNKTANAAWRNYLGLDYDKSALLKNEDGSYRLPDEVSSQIETDTIRLKNKINNLLKIAEGNTDSAINASGNVQYLQNYLNKLRKVYKGKPTVVNEYEASKGTFSDDGYMNVANTPLNVLHNFTLKYDNNNMKYFDIYDFNKFDKFIPGKKFVIRGTVPKKQKGGKMKVNLPQLLLNKRIYNNVRATGGSSGKWDNIKEAASDILTNYKFTNNDNIDGEIFGYSLGQKDLEQLKHWEVSPYSPSKSEDNDVLYIRMKNRQNSPERYINDEIIDELESIPERKKVFGNFDVKEGLDPLAGHTVSLGEDKNGKYISIYDKWDFANPIANYFLRRKPEIYDRTYYQLNPKYGQPNTEELKLKELKSKVDNSRKTFLKSLKEEDRKKYIDSKREFEEFIILNETKPHPKYIPVSEKSKGGILKASAGSVIAGIDIKNWATASNHEQVVRKVYEKIKNQIPEATAENINNYINSVSNVKKVGGSPITGDMIINSAKKNNVDPYLIMAISEVDSHYGTAGKAVRTKNAGNWGNMDDGSEHTFKNWAEGIDKIGWQLNRWRTEETPVLTEESPILAQQTVQQTVETPNEEPITYTETTIVKKPSFKLPTIPKSEINKITSKKRNTGWKTRDTNIIRSQNPTNLFNLLQNT